MRLKAHSWTVYTVPSTSIPRETKFKLNLQQLEGVNSTKKMSSVAASAAVDFASIEEMDPSVADGFRVIYDREVPFELRLQESAEGPNDVGTLEAIKVSA